jgi:hypothetical protein
MKNEKAIPQDALELNLNLVRNGKHPERDISDYRSKVKMSKEIIRNQYGVKKDFDFNKQYYKLPFECFSPFSKEDKMRLKLTSLITVYPTFQDHLQSIREFEVINKIWNSQWRYGFGQDWNTLVRAYNGMKRFKFGDGFEVKIDRTTGCNEKGFTEYERVYVDGVFGFFIYHKGKHVLTIGFSFADRNRLLIQQVQLKNKKGNRFLYKLPCNILDYSIEKMAEAFYDMNIYLCQADDQIESIQESYAYNLEDKEKFLKKDAPRLKKFYSKRLRSFVRRPSQTKFHDVRFRKLIPKTKKELDSQV